jgi:hypothetical protein
MKQFFKMSNSVDLVSDWDPDRQALVAVADPDPAKKCKSDLFRIHNEIKFPT